MTAFFSCLCSLYLAEGMCPVCGGYETDVFLKTFEGPSYLVQTTLRWPCVSLHSVQAGCRALIVFHHTKHINTPCGQNVELLNIKAGGRYNYQC
jgi:hypothetical protein